MVKLYSSINFVFVLQWFFVVFHKCMYDGINWDASCVVIGPVFSHILCEKINICKDIYVR